MRTAERNFLVQLLCFQNSLSFNSAKDTRALKRTLRFEGHTGDARVEEQVLL